MNEDINIESILNKVMGQISKTRKNGEQLLYFCPQCNHKKRKLEFCVERGIFNCWTCNFRGTVFTLLKKYNASHDDYEKIKIFYKQTTSVFPKKNEFQSNIVTLPNEFQSLMVLSDHPEYKNALAYLIRRKLTKEDIYRYNIGYCSTGEYEHHIIFPSYDANGKLNFFIGRQYYDIEGSIPYKKPKISMNIIGFECFINWKEPINLCEGVFDACAIRNNAIPLFGKYLQPILLNKIVQKNVKQVNIVLDNDAMNSAIKNYQQLKQLSGDIQVNIVKLDGKDPSDLGYNKITKLIKNSSEFNMKDLLFYKLRNETLMLSNIFSK